jgi:hypothetical protein
MILVLIPGCIEGLQPHLQQLVPWLINSLGDKKVSLALA